MREHVLSHHPVASFDAVRPAGRGVVRFVVDRFLLLPIGAIVALVWANSAAVESYFRFSLAAAFAVNEIAMALFLALVVQEVFEAMMRGGALHTWRRWGLPVVAAAGGTAGAVLVYLLYVNLKYETMLEQAWPIACAIDVAAAYYLVKTIFRRGSVLPFVLLLALATDAFGVALLAFRPAAFAPRPGGILLLLGALGLAAVLRQRKVRTFWPYIAVCGTMSWFALYLEGIHPALALVPIVPFLPHEPRSLDLLADTPDDDPVHHYEHEWNEVVQVVLFFFGLVNAGVILKGYGTGTWAMLASSLIGRPVGILAAVGLALACGLHLPRRLGWRALVVAAIATSSGFTFALFMATGLMPVGPLSAEIKLGALATVAAAFVALAAARALRVGRFAK